VPGTPERRLDSRGNSVTKAPPLVRMPPHADADWFAEHAQPHEAMLRAWLANRFGFATLDRRFCAGGLHAGLTRAPGARAPLAQSVSLHDSPQPRARFFAPASCFSHGRLSGKRGVCRLGRGQGHTRAHRPQPETRTLDRSRPIAARTFLKSPADPFKGKGLSGWDPSMRKKLKIMLQLLFPKYFSRSFAK